MAELEEPETYKGSNGEMRVKHGEVVIPIVTGTIAQQLPKSKVAHDELAQGVHAPPSPFTQGLPGEATHRWVFYIRSPLGHDLSVLISKVTVHLHSSFANPKREFTNPPYEVEEAGWGEFDITIVLTLHQSAQSSDVELSHRLKLFQDAPGTFTKNKHVVYEQYEELVIYEPTVDFAGIAKVAPRAEPAHRALDPTLFATFDEQAELRKLTAARQKVATIAAQIRLQIEGGEVGTPGGEPSEAEPMVE